MTRLLALLGHTAPVVCLRVSADGSRGMSGSYDGTIRLWDIDRASEIRRIDIMKPGSAIALSTDLSVAVWAEPTDNAFAVVDLEKEEWESIPVFQGHVNVVTCVACSEDGSLLLSGSADRTIRVWERGGRTQLHRLAEPDATVTCVALAPNRSRIISGDQAGNVLLWILNDQTTYRLAGHTARISSVAFSGDGSKALSASWDGTVGVWDAHTGKEICRFSGHTNIVACAEFSLDGKYVMSGGYSALFSRDQSGETLTTEDCVRLWDSNKATESLSFHPAISPISAIAFSPDRVLLGGGDSTTSDDPSRDELYRRHAIHVFALNV